MRAYGDTAVTSYRMTAWAMVEGMEIKRQLCITNVWMKRNGHSQIVARHTASLPGDRHPRPRLAGDFECLISVVDGDMATRRRSWLQAGG